MRLFDMFCCPKKMHLTKITHYLIYVGLHSFLFLSVLNSFYSSTLCNEVVPSGLDYAFRYTDNVARKWNKFFQLRLCKLKYFLNYSVNTD